MWASMCFECLRKLVIDAIAGIDCMVVSGVGVVGDVYAGDKIEVVY